MFTMWTSRHPNSFQCQHNFHFNKLYLCQYWGRGDCNKAGASWSKTVVKTNTLKILHNKYMLVWECSPCEHQDPLAVFNANTIFTSNICLYFNIGGGGIAIRSEHLEPRQHPNPRPLKSFTINTCWFENVHHVNIKPPNGFRSHTQFSLQKLVVISTLKGEGIKIYNTLGLFLFECVRICYF